MTELSNSLASGSCKVSPVNNSKDVTSNGVPTRSDGAYHVSTDATLFSSSLPVFSHAKLNLYGSNHGYQSLDDVSPGLSKHQQDTENIDSIETLEIQDIENILPDDDDLLAGISDDFDLSGLPGSLEELEEYDIFGTGGLELENDSRESLSSSMSKLGISDKFAGHRTSQLANTSVAGNIAGEHPCGEHPSRTLFVRNINSNVEESELRSLFEQYGDIRSMYTACKHRGFVMISYYDIRAARTAMRTLQNKPLRRRKLDIHYSIPKDNPSDKDMNQGTLVIFNLDPSVSNEELIQIFGACGEVKEIRETPNKRHHKFIEFYDVRAAEAALKVLNRTDIAGKRIKLEPSRPGGARRNLMLHSNQDFELEDSWSSWHQAGSPVMNSPPGNWMSFKSAVEHSPLHTVPQSSGLSVFSSTGGNMLPGLSSILQHSVKNPMRVPPLGQDQGKSLRIEHLFSDAYSGHGVSFQQSHSLPNPKMSLYNSTISSSRTSTSNAAGAENLSGQQFLWGGPKLYTQQSNSGAWPKPGSSPFSPDEAHGHLYLDRNSSFVGLTPQHFQHLVGSEPSRVPLERHFGFFPKSRESSFPPPVAFGERNLGNNDGSFVMNNGAQAARNAGITSPTNMSEKGSNFEMRSSTNIGPFLSGNSSHLGFPGSSIEGPSEWGHNGRMESNDGQLDRKKQFHLDLDKIKSGEDTRTTLMIKNIPNKYTSKMLLAAIDENHKGTYDFFYLPIDFKNKCNVGYAFINMLSPAGIIPLYEEFNGKKWEKFNSEKIASLAYARIQGKTALVSHFQNSSLMNEDKRCRPIVFHSGDSKAGNQEHVYSNNVSFHGQQPNMFCSIEAPGSSVKDMSGGKPEMS